MATLWKHSHTWGVETLAEHASSPEPHRRLSERWRTAGGMNWLFGLVTVIAVASSAIAVWHANTISERNQENLVQHIRYHYELTDNSTWDVKLHQISGSPYPLNLVTFTPFFNDATEGRSLAKSKLSPNIDERYPQYTFSNIKEEICRKQTHNCENRSIVALTIEYTIYDEPRTLRLYHEE